MVSAWGSEKMNVNLFAPADTTFIVSVGNWDCEESSFHLPAKGSSAAREVPVKRQMAISSFNACFNVSSSLYGVMSSTQLSSFSMSTVIRVVLKHVNGHVA